jgi:hypothetical protein
MKWLGIFISITAVVLGAGQGNLWAAVEIEGWGDLRGFRIDGQLMQVTTSLGAARPDWKENIFTGHWQQRQLHFTQEGDDQIYSGQIAFKDGQALAYRYLIHDLGQDSALMKIDATPQADMQLDGVYFSVSAPLADYAGAEAELVGVTLPTTRSSEISTTRPATNRHYLRGVASGVQLTAAHRRLRIDFTRAMYWSKTRTIPAATSSACALRCIPAMPPKTRRSPPLSPCTRPAMPTTNRRISCSSRSLAEIPSAASAGILSSDSIRRS